MKKSIALCLAFVTALSFAACGAAPVSEAAVPATETPAVETVVATPEPAETVATEPPAPQTVVYTGEEECNRMLSVLGYREANLSVYGKNLERINHVSGASVTPASMEVTGNDFAMKLNAMQYFYVADEVRQTDNWMLYGTRGEELCEFLGLEEQGYILLDTSILSDGTYDIFEGADYTYYRFNEDGKAEAMAFVTAYYYPSSGNLYNVVQTFYESPEEYATATILASTIQDYLGVTDVEILRYGEFTIELHNFIVQCDGKSYIYQYRPGMSFSDWACSELNTDGWIPWYDDTVLSPDRKYIAGTGYLPMEPFGDEVLTLYAEPFDGGLDHTYLYSIEAMDYEGALEYLKSDESEIQTNGNINVPVAHMVNARTPLMTPGFRTVGREEGRAAYHSVELGNGLFLKDDIIDIYMNGIEDALIPHIKLYAFPESEEFMATLEGQLILNAHTTPLDKDSPMLTIPEDAVCLTFQRVPDGQEAPNSPNPRRPGHENLNKDAVFARYVTLDDPNFGEGVNMVFAVTYDDELVYWIHMGANFHETVDVTWIVNAMGY